MTTHTCNCHPGMDVRGRCTPEYDETMFKICPARLYTIDFYIGCFENNDVWDNINGHRVYLMDKYNIKNNKEWLAFKRIYNENRG